MRRFRNRKLYALSPLLPPRSKLKTPSNSKMSGYFVFHNFVGCLVFAGVVGAIVYTIYRICKQQHMTTSMPVYATPGENIPCPPLVNGSEGMTQQQQGYQPPTAQPQGYTPGGFSGNQPPVVQTHGYQPPATQPHGYQPSYEARPCGYQPPMGLQSSSGCFPVTRPSDPRHTFNEEKSSKGNVDDLAPPSYNEATT